MRRTVLLGTATAITIASAVVAGRSVAGTTSEIAPPPATAVATGPATTTAETTTTLAGAADGRALVHIDGCGQPGVVNDTWLLVEHACTPADPALSVGSRSAVTDGIDLLRIDAATAIGLRRLDDPAPVSANHAWSPTSTRLSGATPGTQAPPISSASFAVGDLICQTGERCPIRLAPRLAPRLSLARWASSHIDLAAPECSAAVDRFVVQLAPRIGATGVRCVDDPGLVAAVDVHGCAIDPRLDGAALQTGAVVTEHRYELRVAEIGVGSSVLLTLPASESVCFGEAFAADQLSVRFRTVVIGPEPLSGLLTAARTPIDPPTHPSQHPSDTAVPPAVTEPAITQPSVPPTVTADTNTPRGRS